MQETNFTESKNSGLEMQAYNLQCFSVFFETMNSVSDYIHSQNAKLSIKKYEIKDIKLLSELEDSSLFYSKAGGSHLPQFYIWEDGFHKKKTFFISNYEDGMNNLTRFIAKNANINVLDVAFFDENHKEKYMYRKLQGKGMERYVHLIRDSNWDFFEKGQSLSYEYVENYQKRNLSKRLNRSMIISYLRAEGVNYELLLKDMIAGTYFKRLEW